MQYNFYTYGEGGDIYSYFQKEFKASNYKFIKYISESESNKAEIDFKDSIPVILGGSHSITYYGVKAAIKEYSSIGVIQFDAHLDMKDTYGIDKDSNACVMRRIRDNLTKNTLSLGVREISKEEKDYAFENQAFFCSADSLTMTDMNEFSNDLCVIKSQNVYLTIDLDVLDPSIMSEVEYPEPDGILFENLILRINRIFSFFHVVGIDVVEYKPITGHPGQKRLICQILNQIIKH